MIDPAKLMHNGEPDTGNLRATLRAANFGELMSILLQSERHQNLTLATVADQFVPAFLSDQYVLARAVPDREGAPGTPVGLAIYASISQAVADRIVAGPLPVQLAPEDWKSGDIVAVLDVIGAAPIGKQMIEKIREKTGADKRIAMLVSSDQGKLSLNDVT